MATGKRRRRPTPHYDTLAAYFAGSGESQHSLAFRLGLKDSTVSRLVRGLRVPRPLLAQRLARACHIPPSSFMAVYLARQRRPNKRRAA
jgi:transcriptional regulator with XRE-family HTH domain